MSGPVDLQEFVAGFIVEAEEYLDSVNRNLVAASNALKENRAEPRAVRELFRSLHTIKGLASMVGADPVVAVAHEMEGILRTADRAGGKLSDETLDLLLQGTRVIEDRVQVIAKSGMRALTPAPVQLLEALILIQGIDVETVSRNGAEIVIPDEILKALTASEREQTVQAISSGKRVVLVDFHPSPENSENGFNITSVRAGLGKIGDLIKVIPRSSPTAPTGIVFSLLMVTSAENGALTEASNVPNELIKNVTLSTNAPVSAAASSDANPDASSDANAGALATEPEVEWTPTDHASIRVDIRRLDEALERLSDLVITRSKLARVASEMTALGVNTRELNLVIAENTRQLKRLRAAVTKARMVPLAELLQRLPLVVRGLTKDADKRVDLEMRVGTVEVDKAVADKIFPAIVHLVRNAVDHALESRPERSRAGKPEAGALLVTCEESSGSNITITMRDDGRGVDREAVARKAGRAVAKSDEELLDQITLPGLSTRNDVSLTSGRGMGMDIVKRTVEMLGGTFSMSTVQGKGTVFTLTVPVSITIVDILSFVSGGQTFAVPVSMIDEIIELDSSVLAKSPSPLKQGPRTSLLQRRGATIPYLSLDEYLTNEAKMNSKIALVVNQLRGGAVAFGVDRMIGQQEVVVRPLDDVLVRVAGMAGATDLGDGRPTLVLDLANLGAAVQRTAVVTV